MDEDRRLKDVPPVVKKFQLHELDRAKRDENTISFLGESIGAEPIFSFDARSSRITVAAGRFQTGLSRGEVSANRFGTARAFLARHGQGIGLSNLLPNLKYHSEHTDAEDGSTLVKFRQQYQGVEVLFGEARVQFDSEDDAVTLLVANIDPEIVVSTTAQLLQSYPSTWALSIVS